MIENKEFRTFLKNVLFLLLILLGLSYFFSNWQMIQCENSILEEKTKIFANFRKQYPEQEQLLLNILIHPETVSKTDRSELEKYGLTSNTLRELSTVKELRKSMYFSFSLLFCITLLALSGVYLYHMKRFYQKLDKVNLYIHDVLNDNYKFNIREYEEGTFASLKNDVYKITNKLKEQNDNIAKDKKYLEETLSDISHQLKTPLTSMYMINNLLEDDKLDSKTKKAFLKKNEAQLERIEWLVTSLLKLSRLESGTIQLKKESVKVVDLLKKALEPLLLSMDLKSQRTSFKGNLNTVVNCDFNWTVEALLNMIKNAHEHTAENGEIHFAWQDNPLYVAITITDNGEGIDKEDLPHIFERFYKGSHNGKESIGIGLNMAYQIIDRQNGEITVKSQKQVGTCFTIKFYKNIY